MDETAANALRESLKDFSAFMNWLVENADDADVMLKEGISAEAIRKNTPVDEVFHDSQSVVEAVFALEEALNFQFEYNANADGQMTMGEFYGRIPQPEAVD